MNTPSQVPTLNFKKLGLLAMTPIALVIHGLVLWIPMNTETKKEKEPEKKEELQAIGDIVSIPPTAMPTPKAAASIAPSTTIATNPVPSSTQTIIERIVQVQPSPTLIPKPTPSSVTPSVTPTTPPIIQPVKFNTPEDVLTNVLGAVPCPNSKLQCKRVKGKARQDILNSFFEKFSNVPTLIKGGTNEYPIAFQVQDKEGKPRYFKIEPASDSSVEIIFMDEQQVLDIKKRMASED